MFEFSSRLSRLFTYSKDALFYAQENFTTEALAIAVEDDPCPLVSAILQLNATDAARVGLAACTDEVPVYRLKPTTQVLVPGGGRLDLVLEVLSEGGRIIGAVWIEIKINAPESGSQLTAYEEIASAFQYPVWLITLAPEVLNPRLANLTWLHLYRAARHARVTSRSWTDLLAFLEEQDVANDSLGPISDLEAAATEPAYRLAQKVTAVVKQVHRELPSIFGEVIGPKLKWKAEGELLNLVGASFRQSGEMWGASKSLRYGLTARDGTAYWTIAVMPGKRAKAAVDKARSAAEGLREPWEKPGSGPTILVARARATALESHEAALDWFRTRLRELASANVLDQLDGAALGHAGPVIESGFGPFTAPEGGTVS